MVWLVSLLSFTVISITTTDTHTEYLAAFSFVLILILPLFNQEALMNDD